MQRTAPPHPLEDAAQGDASAPQETLIASETLLRGQNVVTIAHHGVHYRLQETRAGKLILTK